jgi:hypothetical protein
MSIEDDNIPESDFVLPIPPEALKGNGINYDSEELLYDAALEAMETFNRQYIGYVYILGSSTGYYKIGRSINLLKRLTTFEVKLPFKVWLELSGAYYDCIWAEHYYHALFAEKRVNGEWFRLDYDDLITFQNGNDTHQDTKLNFLLEMVDECPWTEEFVKDGLGKYSPLPHDRRELVSKYDHFHHQQRSARDIYDLFYFRDHPGHRQQLLSDPYNFDKPFNPDEPEG